MPRTKFEDFKIKIVSSLASFGIWMLTESYRHQTVIHPETQQLIDNQQPVIFSIWHGRMYSLFSDIPRERVSILVSASNDGEMIAQAVAPFGFKDFIRGSHKRQGREAAKSMVEMLRKRNRSVVMTVDGPRGPRHQVKEGVLRISAMARVPIIPVGGACDSFFWKFTKAWDHYEIPQLFTTIYTTLDAPIYVAKAELATPGS